MNPQKQKSKRRAERHLIARAGWLRAAVLGANDGILSTSSVIIGVAAGAAAHGAVAMAGVAALVAGAMSMAAGEYVSVSSQSDTEAADLAKERAELQDDPAAEREELAAIYRKRGLDAATAMTVATQLMAKDALAAHARDELGISPAGRARPVQAAGASAASFTAGGAAPLAIALLAPPTALLWLVPAGSLVFLAVLGVLGARVGGAPIWRPTLRVTFWGALAMAVTAAIGRLAGTVV
jgi:VIT1/CCC1 family predicted Fe2+/Mn2+ transporter